MAPATIKGTTVTPPAGTASKPQTVALLSAVRTEMAATIERLKLKPDGRWHSGMLGKTRIIAAVSGMGANSATAALSHLANHCHPDHIVSLGFAGALDPGLDPGEAVRVHWVIDGKGALAHVDGRVPTVRPDDSQRMREQTLLCVERMAGSSHEKSKLFNTHRAVIVDMESFPLAKLCAQRDIKLTMLRAVSDTADMSLPEAVFHWVKPDGTPDGGAAASYLLTHPWQLRTFVRLFSSSRRAGQALAQRAEEIVHQLGAGRA